MQITTKTGFVGFLLALATFTPGTAQSSTEIRSQPESASSPSPSIEARLSAVADALDQRESALSDAAATQHQTAEIQALIEHHKQLIASVSRWLNGGNWKDGSDFANWRNKWKDFNPFVNFRNNW